jgi:hypothetical protein
VGQDIDCLTQVADAVIGTDEALDAQRAAERPGRAEPAASSTSSAASASASAARPARRSASARWDRQPDQAGLRMYRPCSV